MSEHKLTLTEPIESLKVEYNLIIDWNYGDLEDTMCAYKENNNNKIFYVEMNDNDNTLCMGLTLNDIKKIQNHIDIMINDLNVNIK